MTKKEENIVNIAMRAAELLKESRIERSEMTGHAGLTDTIVALADQFERQNAGVNFDAEGRDYWLEIDAFAEEQLIKELGCEKPAPSQEMNIKVIVTDGIVEEVLKDQSLPVHVEVIDVDDNYENYQQLKAYREEIYHNPSYQRCIYTVANFEEETHEETADQKVQEPSCCLVAVTGNARGAVIFEGTWDECRAFGNENQWCYWDPNDFRWELEIEDPREGELPECYYTAVEYFSEVQGKDIETGFVRQHPDALVGCFKAGLTMNDFESWTSFEALLDEKLSLDEYSVLKHARPEIIRDVLGNDAEYLKSMQAILDAVRIEKPNVRPSLAAQIQSAAGIAAAGATTEKGQERKPDLNR